MKQITNKTILKQGDKTYQPVEVDGVVYWIDYYTQKGDFWCIDIDKKIFKDQTHFPISIGQRLIIAQSQPRIEGIPVVSLDSYVNELRKLDLIHLIKIVQKSEDYKSVMGITLENTLKRLLSNYKSNPNQYTQKDIEKAIELARETISSNEAGICDKYTELGILQQINSISVIEVDEQFNIISYE
jgi:hypothetical protein